MILKQLFSPASIGTLVLKNRVIFPAMGTCMADEKGLVTQQLIDYHLARVLGGCGLNIVEVAAIHPTTLAPGFITLHDDKSIEGMTQLVSAIHDAGGKAAVQIWHAGLVSPGVPEGVVRLAPVEIQGYAKGMTKDDISEIVEAYGDAVIRARKAGFDAVELHFGHGYLPAQFLSCAVNFRTDEYGGSLENRMRFPLEILENVRRKVGRNYPVIMRISATEERENGIELEEMKTFSKRCEALGIDAVHVSIGAPAGGSLKYEVPPVDLPVAFNVPNAAAIREVVNVPVIAVGRINDPVVAEKVIEEGSADFVAIGRGQLGDPEFCNKAMADRFETIIKCIGCDQGCFDRFLIPGAFVSCLRNPACGREAEYKIQKIEKPKKVLVAGAGPAGCEAATTLKKRGHEVMLCEKASRPGGQFYLAGVAPRKGEMMDASQQMGKLAQLEGVDLRLQTEVTADFIKKHQPDEVIVAIGAEPFVPPIPGVDKPHVCNSHEVLSGTATVGDKVIVIGGGLVGAEIAELCAEAGKSVVVVEMLPEIAGDLGILRKICVMENIQRHGIDVKVNATCSEITDDGVTIEVNGAIESIQGDTVVLAVGAKSRDTSGLVEYCHAAEIPCHIIGDAVKARRALDAVWEAAELARRI